MSDHSHKVLYSQEDDHGFTSCILFVDLLHLGVHTFQVASLHGRMSPLMLCLAFLNLKEVKIRLSHLLIIFFKWHILYLVTRHMMWQNLLIFISGRLLSLMEFLKYSLRREVQNLLDILEGFFGWNWVLNCNLTIHINVKLMGKLNWWIEALLVSFEVTLGITKSCGI